MPRSQAELTAAAAAAAAATLAYTLFSRASPPSMDPALALDADGQPPSVGDYVAAQILAEAGVAANHHVAAHLASLTTLYLHHSDHVGDVSESLHAELAKGNAHMEHSDPYWHAAFFGDLAAELEHHIAAYFREHWSITDALLAVNELQPPAQHHRQVRDHRWQELAEETRKIGREHIKKRMSQRREFVTLAEVLRAAQRIDCSCDVETRPTIRFLGGGMAAGKSTVLRVLREDWQREAVVVSADELKMVDPLFATLMAERGEHAASVSAAVHEHSTLAANEELMLALGQRKDIVVDGTMTWMPYVQQTLAMVRSVHEYEYRIGAGWNGKSPPECAEEYWVRGQRRAESSIGLPYRVEMIGVTVDPALAVGRALRRTMVEGRGVPVAPLLRSHRLFSQNFRDYLPLVDTAALYDTSLGGAPGLVALHSRRERETLLTDGTGEGAGVGGFEKFLRKASICDSATCARTLYADGGGFEPGPKKPMAPLLRDVLVHHKV